MLTKQELVTRQIKEQLKNKLFNLITNNKKLLLKVPFEVGTCISCAVSKDKVKSTRPIRATLYSLSFIVCHPYMNRLLDSQLLLGCLQSPDTESNGILF